MLALRAGNQIGSRRRRIKSVATDAVKGRFPPLTLEALMVATIVIDPQPKKNEGAPQTVDQCRGLELKHGFSSHALGGRWRLGEV
jgi:hypothetical protein